MMYFVYGMDVVKYDVAQTVVDFSTVTGYLVVRIETETYGSRVNNCIAAG